MVCHSVCRSVLYDRESWKSSETDPDAVWIVDSGGPKESCVTWGPDPVCERAILSGGEIADHCKLRGLFAVSCAKTDEPIEIQFWMLRWVGARSRKFVSEGADTPYVKGQF